MIAYYGLILEIATELGPVPVELAIRVRNSWASENLWEKKKSNFSEFRM